MNSRSSPRPGGRSARVQAAVHQATQQLLDEVGRAALTVPLIAARAGVTPSTIYRRWGDLPDLLADVAVQRLRPEGEPADTGNVRSDLQSWAEQYLEEMSSDIGLSMMRDVLYGSDTQGACRCATITSDQIQIIVDRAHARGEAVPTVDVLMDGVVAPIIYRTLFGPVPATHAHVHALIETCLKLATKKRKASKD
jgi:AcrR family transcriptional regulator